MKQIGHLHGGQLFILWLLTALACTGLVFAWLVGMDSYNAERSTVVNSQTDSVLAVRWDRMIADHATESVATRMTSIMRDSVHTRTVEEFDRAHPTRRWMVRFPIMLAGVLPFAILAATWNWLGARAATRRA